MSTSSYALLAPAHLLSADSALIIDYRDLSWRYPSLTESHYVIDVGGLPWFTMASIVIKARMKGNTSISVFHSFAEEILDSINWPVPEDNIISDMTNLLNDMESRTNVFVQQYDDIGEWIAVNVRSPSTIVFYYVRHAFTRPDITYFNSTIWERL